jgi:hypothetical protein
MPNSRKGLGGYKSGGIGWKLINRKGTGRTYRMCSKATGCFIEQYIDPRHSSMISPYLNAYSL